MRYYGYAKCGTARKALKWLEAKQIKLDAILDITQTPPRVEELEKALAAGYTLKQLFNTSGVLYRQMHMKDKLPGLSQEEALILLSQNGKLVKRPFMIEKNTVTVGFNESHFEKCWL